MAFRWLLAVNILAVFFLGASFLLGFALKRLMGKGKDTGPVKLLLIVIILNGALGLTLLIGGWYQYLSDWVTYVRIVDVSLMLIGIVLTASIAWIYKDYKKLLKKHEPGA